ncbi:transcriptional adapter ADA2-like isoform X2 [Macadamia integrifolia]|uniref:transcriptional adapter ADA2-like isoform X2 n=1 Tax=Macadamia integrifolia TaxID=60698 RepID=UPI001C52BECD|nr:transcriptional adapter ADA2-like isoform X2 [Macadamia integrifolia]
MGRSRGGHNSADDDPTQRSKRKRAPSSGENLESAASAQGSNEGKRALYHCNNCNKDISGKIRIKCVKCPDFDLCVECFSVGSEVTPHRSNHPYRVMDNLSFPLICPDWNADEEILLLEGIEMYGMGNWAEVAEHVGTKTKAQCIDHYTTVYVNSPCFPLPDMSHVVGKNRKELLAMAKGHAEGRKGFPVFGEITLKEDSTFSPSRVKIEDMSKEAPTGSQVDRSVGGKKPKFLSDEGPTMTELSGYNPKRHEFDPEYDNDAEQSLAEMEFKDTDTEADRQLKLRVLHIYSKRLDERKRRKDFILERNLLYPNPLEKELSLEEREMYERYKVFMRFHSKEKHEELIRTIIEEHRTQKRIQDLQEARAAGCQTPSEADRFIEQKRKKEAEENNRRVKESSQVGPDGKVLQRISRPKGEADGSPQGGVNGSMGLDSGGKDSSSTTFKQAISSSLDDWDITGYPGTDLLSETEKWLCREMKLLPPHYLNMQHIMSVGILTGNITGKSEAHRFFKTEPSKVDRVYDMLVKKGIAQP